MAVRPALALSLMLVLSACGGEDDAANQPPVAVDDVATVDEDTPIVINVLANDTDPEGKPLRITRAKAGELDVTVDGENLRVATAPNWNGTLDVTYYVSDGAQTATGHAVVTVNPVNDAPTATAASIAVGRNQAKLIHLEGSDVDGDAVTFEVDSNPAHGTLSGNAPDILYTPATGYVGTDAIVFHARDAALSSSAATLSLTVGAGAAPVATAQNVSTLEDTTKSITLTATDADGDPITYNVTQQPAHGTLSGTAPNLTYTPAANYNGADVFKFVATDGLLTSNPTNVTINITPQNDAPVAQAQTVSGTEDQQAIITLSGTDIDGDALTYTISGAPARGTIISTVGSKVTYKPTANLNGIDSFTFTVSDGNATSAPATVTVDVAAVEDAPVATAQTVSATEDTASPILLTGIDPDGDTLGFALSSSPAHGTLTGTPPAVTYTPVANYNGADAFSFTVTDGHTTSAPVTVTLSVAAVNDVPVVSGAALSGNEGVDIPIPLPATDVDGEALSYTIEMSPYKGRFNGSGANLAFNSLNLNGDFTFSMIASDGHSSSAPAVFTVAVAPVNDPPLARDDIGIATPGQSLRLSVLANDYEFDGETMSVQSVGTPLHGTVVIDGNDLVYTTTPGNIASDKFTYTVADTTGLTTVANVYIGIGEFPSGMPLRYIGMAIDVGTSSFNQILQQDISRDGRYIVFTSRYAITPGDTNGFSDVYIYDRMTLTNERISVSTSGALANGPSERPSISADGRYVAFASTANNLVANDTNGTIDVFVRDRVAGTTKRVSVSSTGAQVSGSSREPDISADGSIVAFVSDAFELVPNDANGAADIFVRDLAADTTARVSVRADGGEADMLSATPVLSDDGNVVAFVSAASNLVAGDTNGKSDVFVHVRSTHTTERVSVTSTGGEANNHSMGRPALSADGRFVAFGSSATNLVSGSTASGTYVRDREALTTLFASSAASGLSLSGDGRYLVAYTGAGQAFVRDRFAATSQTVSTSSAFPVISANGRYITLLSSSNLDNNTHSDGTKVYVYPNPL